MILHVSGIKFEVWDATADLPFYVHINYTGEMVIYDHEYNELDEESVMGQMVMMIVLEQMQRFTPQQDISILGLN